MGVDWDAVLLAPVFAVFGDEEVVFTPGGEQGTDSFDMQLVYDEGNKDIDLAGGSGVNASNPIVYGQQSRFAVDPLQGDYILIVRTGDLFEIKDINNDGRGTVTLSLNFVRNDT